MFGLLFRILKWAAICLAVFVLGFGALLGYFLARNGRVGVDTDFSKSALLKAPAAPLAKPFTLKMITFNIQATWVVGMNRPARMRAIPEYLAPLDPDLVGFQEAFVEADRSLLIEGLKKHTRLAHFQYYPSGSVGSGVLIASAHPIREVWFHRYKSTGAPLRFWEGDGLAGKGIGLARIELPDGAGMVDFFDTHVQAGYGGSNYRTVRQKQLAEAAAFIGSTRTKTVPAFVAGDFNSAPGEPDHEEVVKGADLERVLSIDSGIDHIYAARDSKYRFEIVDSREIPATITRDGKPFDLSDHNGYFSEVRIVPTGK